MQLRHSDPYPKGPPKLFEGAIKGAPAKLHFLGEKSQLCEKVAETMEQIIKEGIADIVILTCVTEEKSMLFPYLTEGKYKGKKFSTCRKFKGLEADAIIMIDISEDTFDENHRLLYYVGASRARLRLEMFTRMGESECMRVLKSSLQYRKKIKKPQMDLANELNAFSIIE